MAKLSQGNRNIDVIQRYSKEKDAIETKHKKELEELKEDNENKDTRIKTLKSELSSVEDKQHVYKNQVTVKAEADMAAKYSSLIEQKVKENERLKQEHKRTKEENKRIKEENKRIKQEYKELSLSNNELIKQYSRMKEKQMGLNYEWWDYKQIAEFFAVEKVGCCLNTVASPGIVVESDALSVGNLSNSGFGFQPTQCM